ncbi:MULTISPECIES: type II secretion system protein [Geobacter]|uniref:Type II secretion system protein n=1 Tax=Geobacter anodireducens TaxID=1340425 RepID=A0ABR9NWJ8_9BACT|nr:MULTISPECIES: type II secretion system protein [Geobacter]MBE2888640.1 type II secretion system protein [Geobacter anodireducens]HMN01557.1 type II secretion system protein [Geobacter anodireducens]
MAALTVRIGRRFRGDSRGLSLIELVFTVAILGILAMAVVPFTQMAAKRTKEIELRRDLRVIRTAIDDYKKDYDKAIKDKKILDVANRSGYPESFEKLIEGEDFGGLYAYKKKYLRRIPVDPFHSPEAGEPPMWGMRSSVDDPESDIWGGEDLYDVYSLSDGIAIDGSKYKDW